MSRENFPQSRILEASELVEQMRIANRRGERFCFILGSGSSVESGMPVGGVLEMRWMNCIMGVEDKSDPSPRKKPSLMRKKAEKLKADNLMEYSFDKLEQVWKLAQEKGWRTLPSEYYFDLYNLRFHPDSANGYEYMERLMEKLSPSIGYRILAKLLEENGYRNNLVITTNFDTLLEDALFLYGERKALSMGHEALAEFFSPNLRRSVLVKVHRDRLFHPFNTPEETNHLSKEWEEVLHTALGSYTPIVIGYGGGDRSLMSFLEKHLKKFYWCWRPADGWVEPRVERLLRERKEGLLVSIGGFDALMLELGGQRFPDEVTPTATVKLLGERCEKWTENYQKKYDEVNKNPDTKDAAATIEKKEKAEAEKRAQDETWDKWDYIREAYEADKSGDYEKAIELLNELIEQEPDFADAYNNRGNAWDKLSEYQKAIDDFNEALRLNPDYADAYYNRGNAWFKLGEYQKAINDYNQALRLNPDFAKAYNNRGNAWDGLGEYQKAIDDYNQALRLNPDFAKAYNNRGAAWDDLGEYQKAIDDYNQALRLNPEFAEAYNNRGNAWGDMGEYQKAIDDYTKAIQLDENCKNAYLNRARAYRAIGRDDLAQQDEDTAAKL